MAASTSRYAVAPPHSDRFLFVPVRPQTAFDETLRRLESAIKLGLLAPGSRLPAERELCTRLNISRSTLRQALLILTETGYLHATRGRGGGTFVVDLPPPAPSPSAEDLMGWRETCNERLAVELGTMVLAAARATPDSVAQLRRMTAKLEATTDPVQYCQLDRQLHVAIAWLTESPQLILASTRIQSRIYDLLASIDIPIQDRVDSDESHRELLAALLGHDHRAAMRSIYAHLDETSVLLERELQARALS